MNSALSYTEFSKKGRVPLPAAPHAALLLALARPAGRRPCASPLTCPTFPLLHPRLLPGPGVMQCPCMRPATHAGSWYCAEGPELASDITQWLAAAAAAAAAAVPAAVPSHPAPEPEPPPRAIIGPHAGFAYSGPTAAHAYQHVRPEGIRRVFVLGPSHHVFLRACATSAATSYETPLGELPVDVATTKALQAKSQFKVMSPETDGAEHSIGVRGGAACLPAAAAAGWLAGWLGGVGRRGSLTDV
eukprot:COSAG01_NODE_158_length_23708_cov_7.921979_17_plen_245_part_00